MSKADHALITSANPTPTRRSILSRTARLAGAAVLGYATMHPAEVLAGVSQMAPTNENAELAEARRLIAALLAADDKISAASDAHDPAAEEAAEFERLELDCQLSDLSVKLAKGPPRTRLDRCDACRDCRLSDSAMFADISGFVALTLRLGADKTVELLSRIVSEFDALAARHGVEKIKTIGDAYMVVAGLPEPTPDHTARLARMALDMLGYIAELRTETGLALNIRVGLASGKVTAGVIGTKKFSYDVWGEPVNLASRLEALSAPGRILVCPTCHARLIDAFEFEPRGPIDIKGLGPHETWYLAARVCAPAAGNGT
jgi:class 3 adenylate cyclase